MEIALLVYTILLAGIIYCLHFYNSMFRFLITELKDKNDKIDLLSENLALTIKHVEQLTTEHNKLVNLIHNEINAAKENDIILQAMALSNHVGSA